VANSGPNGEWLATTPEYWAQFIEPIIAFQLWYADGSCVRGGPDRDDLARAWANAPSEGVQVLMVHHDALDRRSIVVAKDEYTYPGLEGSKLGLEIDLTIYRQIKNLAMEDEWRVR
jgi:hypothetical protein